MTVADLMPEHPKGSIHDRSIVDEVVHGQINLQVSVVSPERQLYHGEAHWITLTGTDGQFGIWPRHVAMVAALGGGPLLIGLPNHDRAEFVVSDGFVSVADNVITILVDRAVTKDDVDAEAARRELEVTNAALAHPDSDRDFARLMDRRSWCQACIKLAGAA